MVINKRVILSSLLAGLACIASNSCAMEKLLPRPSSLSSKLACSLSPVQTRKKKTNSLQVQMSGLSSSRPNPKNAFELAMKRPVGPSTTESLKGSND